MIDEEKNISLVGDRKVKVEEGFVKRIKNFFRNFIKGNKNGKVLEAVKGLGVKFISIFKKKQIEPQNEEIEVKNEEQETKHEEIETPTETEIPSIPEPKEEELHKPAALFTLAEKRVMPELEDTIPTTEPEIEEDIAEDEEKEEPVKLEPDDKVKEILECVKNDDKDAFIKIISEEGYRNIADLVFDNFNLGKISEEENTEFVTMRNEIYDENGELKEEYQPDAEESQEIEEPTIPEEHTEDVKTTSINLQDLTQFASYTDYLTAYRHERIADKDVDRFYTDLYNKNLPSDLLDEKTFIKERKRQEDEKEQRKIESKKAEVEKKLAEERAKHAAASDKVQELESSIQATEAKLKAQREETVTLRQQMVDADSKIADLERENKSLNEQLAAAQETAKRAQARSYEDRKTLSEMEKEIEELKKHAAKLEKELEASKQDTTKLRKELEETKARISENTQAALDRIKELRTPEDDDIEKTALDWAETKLKQNLQEEQAVSPEPISEPVSDDTIITPLPEQTPEQAEGEKKIGELKEAKNQALVAAIVAEAGDQPLEETRTKTR